MRAIVCYGYADTMEVVSLLAAQGIGDATQQARGK